MCLVRQRSNGSWPSRNGKDLRDNEGWRFQRFPEYGTECHFDERQRGEILTLVKKISRVARNDRRARAGAQAVLQ